MKFDTGYLVLESGNHYRGIWRSGRARAGEVVFNTSHTGYEEMATDPSYFSQILVPTTPMQGNYGADDQVWESRKIWIHGFACLQMQETSREHSWLGALRQHEIPVLTDFDTRDLVLHLRHHGTVWGALVPAADAGEAQRLAAGIIAKSKGENADWVHAVSRPEPVFFKGAAPKGPRVAVLDFGVKENILREISLLSQEVSVWPARTLPTEIRRWEPDGILLSNGPGDPSAVQIAVDTIRDLMGWRPIFGICMGHQLLARALGARTFKIKFGHRGGNHPVKDLRDGRVYVTSQNHGYAVDSESLPAGTEITHVNLNDNTIEGIRDRAKRCMSVQFHPESHPGPHEARELFAEFVGQLL